MTELAAWLPAAGAVLFILGWLGIEAFFRRFSVTAAQGGFGTTEAIALAGVQLAVVTVAGVAGYLAGRWVLVYLPPRSPELFVRLRIEWVGIIFWVFFVLPLLLLLPGGSPFGPDSNAPLILFITVGVVAGAVFDHWQWTDRGTTSPLQLRNIGLIGLWAVIGLIVSLAPLLGAEALKRGETAYRRSLLVGSSRRSSHSPSRTALVRSPLGRVRRDVPALGLQDAEGQPDGRVKRRAEVRAMLAAMIDWHTPSRAPQRHDVAAGCRARRAAR